MDKNRVKISDINLNAPPFFNEHFAPTNINFIFGKNGTGKTSIGRAIKKSEGVTYIPDGAFSTSVQVFNDEYIKANIDGKLDGVFTISEPDIETEREIASLTDRSGLEGQIQKRLREEQVKLLAQRDDLTTSVQTSCWDITRKILKQLKHNPTNASKKTEFYKQISEVSPKEHDIFELQRLEELAYDPKATHITPYRAIRFRPIDLSLLETPIVALEETQFSKFMKSLGSEATDWVYKGFLVYQPHSGDKCPYCQQELNGTIVKNLEAAFDETYTKAVEALKNLREQDFPSFRFGILDQLEEVKTGGGYRFIDAGRLKIVEEQLNRAFDKIEATIDKKMSAPSAVEKADGIEDFISAINELIEEANLKIDEHNALIGSGNKKALFEKAVREHLAFVCKEIINQYDKELKKKVAEIGVCTAKLNESEHKRDEYQLKLNELQKKTTSTLPVIDSINNLLKASGFNSFSIAPSGERNYKLVRPDNSNATYLSEGEKNFICFLYFYYSVFGILSEDRGLDDRVVVIDDPVSSMDSDAVFIISELVRNIIDAAINAFNPIKEDGVATHIKQVFIMTHNSFFYNEVAPAYLTYYETVSYFEIIKEDLRSHIVLNVKKINQNAVNEKEINYIPELGNYASLWEIYRTTDNPRILMNTMRRILEEYFMHNLGYTSGRLKKELLVVGRPSFTEPAEYTLARALVNYISNDAISSVNFSTYTSDMDKLKSVFYKLFEMLHQTQHFEMMLNR